MRPKILPAILVCLACTALGGCDWRTPEEFQSTDIAGAPFGRDFQLTDQNGTERRLSDFKGKAVVMFFGYTNCPDACPTTMLKLATAMKTLGPLAERVQVLFVTVDPERDTQEVLRQYVPAFYPSFLGLRGTPEQTRKTADEFKVVYQKIPGASPAAYSVDHSVGCYVFDPEGALRLFVPVEGEPEVFVHDLKLLLQHG